MGNAAKQLTDATTLQDLTLTKKKIKAKKIPVKQVFEVLENGEKFTPIWQEDLKAFLRLHGVLFNTAKVRAFGDSEWIPLTIHPTFQRRKQGADGKVNSVANRYHLIIRGVKQGPFSELELKEELKNRTILYTDFVSVDTGVTWNKIYQIHNFDRRGMDAEELPPSPKKEIFKQSQEEAEHSLDEQNKTQMAIAGLAKMGQTAKKSEKEKKPNNPKILKEIEGFANKLKSSSKFKSAIIATLSLIIILATVAIILRPKVESPTTANKQIIKPQRISRRAVTTEDRPKKIERPKRRVVKPTPRRRTPKIAKKRRTIEPVARKRPAKKRRRRPAQVERPRDDEIIEEVLPEDLEPIEDEDMLADEEDFSDPYQDEEENRDPASEDEFDDSLQDPGEDGVMQEGVDLYD